MEMDGKAIRKSILRAGVNNLRDFGFPTCDEKNVLTDKVFRIFFLDMLKESLGKMGERVDVELKKLISEIKSKKK